MTKILQTIIVFSLGLVLLVSPSLFSQAFTESFVLPKLLLLSLIVLCSTILISFLAIWRRLVFRQTSLSLPIALYLLTLLLTSIFSVSLFDSLITYFPILFGGLFFFIAIHTVSKDREIVFLSLGFLIGAAIACLLTILSFLGLLPITTQTSTVFTPFGSHLEHLIFNIVALFFLGIIIYPALSRHISILSKYELPFAKNHSDIFLQTRLLKIILFSCAFLLISCLSINAYMVLVREKPVLLSLPTGMQIAIGVLTDENRFIKQILTGTGLGTYLEAFTQYRPVSLNTSTYWNVPYSQGTSFFFELLTTTGLLGGLSFLFLVKRFLQKNLFYLPATALIVLSFIFPISLYLQGLLFIMFGFLILLTKGPHSSFIQQRETSQIIYKEYQRHSVIRVLAGLFCLLTSTIALYFVLNFIRSDILMRQSFSYLGKNDLATAYIKQNKAVLLFPYEDGFYRAFSQTNLAVVAALSRSEKIQADSDTRKAFQLYLQQAIASGKKAASLSQHNAVNWNNLAVIYSSLIGVGRNSEEFAVIATRKAIQLDPSNPQQYLNLGGLYYRVGEYAASEREFRKALLLKPDLVNGYYNLGFALKAQGKTADAKKALETGLKYIDPASRSFQILSQEITNLPKDEGSKPQTALQPEGNQLPLQVATPSGQPLQIEGLN